MIVMAEAVTRAPIRLDPSDVAFLAERFPMSMIEEKFRTGEFVRIDERKGEPNDRIKN